MSNNPTVDVVHIAKLANLQISTEEERKFEIQFSETLKTVEQMNELDTKNTKETSQVTGLVNVTHDDKIDESRMLNINKYFKVPAIFDE